MLHYGIDEGEVELKLQFKPIKKITSKYKATEVREKVTLLPNHCKEEGASMRIVP